MEANRQRIGWIGAGRMGYELVLRVLDAGYDVAVWNRTRAKAEPLEEHGATVVDSPADLADCDLVVTIVSSSAVFEAVTTGPDGLFSRGRGPGVLIDSSTISAEASQRVAAEASKYGTPLLAAPVSGNPNVVKAGKLTVVASGDDEAFERSRTLLEAFGSKVTYVGQGDEARLVKMCHNVLLGIVAQSLAEITILAERAGVSRADFLEFINSSVMGSVFSRYKTPALVNLDFTPTFTGHLLRKDLELGLAAAREFDVPMPVASTTHQMIVHLIGRGHGDEDFASLLALEAEGAGLELVSEDRDVTTGLETAQDGG